MSLELPLLADFDFAGISVVMGHPRARLPLFAFRTRQRNQKAALTRKLHVVVFNVVRWFDPIQAKSEVVIVKRPRLDAVLLREWKTKPNLICLCDWIHIAGQRLH